MKYILLILIIFGHLNMLNFKFHLDFYDVFFNEKFTLKQFSIKKHFILKRCINLRLFEK
jgi:hypothetical protein